MKGTKSGKQLIGIIEEVETARERKKQYADQETAIFAQAKADGFDVKTIRRVLKLRSQDVEARDNAQTLLDTYLHAVGMLSEVPLFAAFGAAGVDMAAQEQAVEFLKTIVPPKGEIVLRLGGTPIRVYRDAEGVPLAEEIVDDPPAPTVKRAAPPSRLADFESVDATKPKKSYVESAADRAERASKARSRQPTDTTVP